MRAKFILLFLLALPAHLSAETRVYWVNRAVCFPQDRYATSFSPLEFKYFIDTGKKIKDVKGDLFRVTNYRVNYNFKYALWVVDSSDVDELKSMDSMVKQNCITLIRTLEPVAVDKEPYTETEIAYQELGALPTDYYEVAVSSN